MCPLKGRHLLTHGITAPQMLLVRPVVLHYAPSTGGEPELLSDQVKTSYQG